MYKKEKGITLIALVVTIIVTIILASITITALSGKKSTINQTTDIAENAQKESIESIIEKIEADLLKEKIKTGNTPTKNDLKRIIQENSFNNGSLGENDFTVKDGGYTISYNEIVGWE